MTTIIRATQQNTAQQVTYTNSFSDGGSGAVTATVIFTPAANVNGAYVELIGFSGTASTSASSCTSVTIAAKSTAPTTAFDGDVIFKASSGFGTATNAVVAVNIQQMGRIKIAAGKGLYLTQTVPSTPAALCEKTVLYTLL